MNQKTKILEMLKEREWVCSSDFLKAYLSEYRSLINLLRKDNYIVHKRSCKSHRHNSKKLQEWHLYGHWVNYKEIGQKELKELSISSLLTQQPLM